ncbi:GAF and ANTAR domain-containing protein [Streptomyces microflavus]|uniref:GAF and ANTAR domain-containing protein n=1 Tax=Streptomyces microflavus TaxID=1919 RepID=A0A7H8N0H2_STRMI|nr:GAF and ANTAR domain-containing protein [Streptomyces microflavus]QKW47977.1 GAF and ANTAR domain-containing protein [Streptomyces microflavus]
MAKTVSLLQVKGAGGITGVVQAGCEVLNADGLAVSLLVPGIGLEPEAFSNGLAQAFGDLQFTLGEGPSVDAARTGRVVSVGDLVREPGDRWPLLVREVAAVRVRSVFCFPLAIGAIRVGVLTATRRQVSALTRQQSDDALALGAALTHSYLSGEPDRLHLPPYDDFHHTVVHQATGMLSVQLQVPLAQALLRLRAHAYAKNRPITDIAQDVVDRRLRLSPPIDGESTPSADKD